MDKTDIPKLSTRALSLAYGDHHVVRDLSIDFTPGAITSIVGPNGCGKSTVLRSLARLLKPHSGQVLLGNTPVHDIAPRRYARSVGLLPQHPVAPDGITVADLVGRGRTPHQGFFGRWSSQDYLAVAEAMDTTGVSELAHAPVNELSGGQRQRVWIAMALAQHTDVLLLDEPTTYLDVKHQLEVLDILTDLNKTRGTTVIMVLHDLNLSARYSDELIALRDGAIVAHGAPETVITAETVREMFSIDSTVIADPVSGTPAVMPQGRHHNLAKVSTSR